MGASRSNAATVSSNPAAIIVEQGKVLDYIDERTQRRETPEEYVRQEIAKSLVHEYGYAKADIAVEFTIRMGTRRPRADLVIFQPEMAHKPENALIIVECKDEKVKPGSKKDGVAQLESYLYACPNALYGLWTNGEGGDRICYKRIARKDTVSLEAIFDIPRKGQSESDLDRPAFGQLKPATSDALLFAFKRCHNHIAGNQGLNKQQAFWELLKIIFCKIHDEIHNTGESASFYASRSELHGPSGPVKVKKRIDSLFDNVKDEFSSIFKTREDIELHPKVLAYIVSQLQFYTLLESEIDVKGRAYEEIVGSNLRGDRGEFFTPRNICQMAVFMLNPQEGQLVLDPACGTGGFLITAMNHVISSIKRSEEQKWGEFSKRAGKAATSRITSFAKKKIVGIDFNPDLVKASKMNMVMNNDGEGGLFSANTLNPQITWPEDLRKRKLIGKVDVLFTNPPFGSRIPVSDPGILEQYNLGHIWTYEAETDRWIMSERLQRSQPPEILFIERCVQFLKPGTGRLAIVLPDGVLGSPGLGYVREWILRNTRILASIDHHPDTFQPFVSVQTSLLVLQRKTQEQINLETAAGKISDYEVFMAIANHIGHDKRGNKTYVRDAQGKERIVEIEKPTPEVAEDGTRVYHTRKVQMKQIDDNTLQIAQEFRKWLSRQD